MPLETALLYYTLEVRKLCYLPQKYRNERFYVNAIISFLFCQKIIYALKSLHKNFWVEHYIMHYPWNIYFSVSNLLLHLEQHYVRNAFNFNLFQMMIQTSWTVFSLPRNTSWPKAWLCLTVLSFLSLWNKTWAKGNCSQAKIPDTYYFLSRHWLWLSVALEQCHFIIFRLPLNTERLLTVFKGTYVRTPHWLAK